MLYKNKDWLSVGRRGASLPQLSGWCPWGTLLNVAGPLVHGVPSLGHGPGWNVTSSGMQEDLKGHV